MIISPVVGFGMVQNFFVGARIKNPDSVVLISLPYRFPSVVWGLIEFSDAEPERLRANTKASSSFPAELTSRVNPSFQGSSGAAGFRTGDTHACLDSMRETRYEQVALIRPRPTYQS